MAYWSNICNLALVLASKQISETSVSYQEIIKYALKTHDNCYISAHSDRSIKSSNSLGTNEKFTLIPVHHNGDLKFGLLTAHGRFLAAKNDNSISTKDYLQEWEYFHFIPT
jgi:hypothetical protein